MKKDADGFEFREKVCVQCKRRFIQQSKDWVYKAYLGSFERVFCSWKCLRAWEKNHDDKVVRRERIKDEILKGKTVKEIVEELDEDPKLIIYWRDKLTKEQKDGEGA